MCGRATITSSYKEVEEFLGFSFESDLIREYNDRVPNFNVAPTHELPIYTAEDDRPLAFMRWGLIPFWAKDHKIGSRLINARAETVPVKASFRAAFKKRRCLVILDGYYEWRKSDEGKIPYRITYKSGKPFAVAGLWENWKSPDGQNIQSFTMITRAANVPMSSIHHRMPYAVKKEYHRLWLEGQFSGPGWEHFMEESSLPFQDYYRVSTDVNKVANNQPELLQAVE